MIPPFFKNKIGGVSMRLHISVNAMRRPNTATHEDAWFTVTWYGDEDQGPSHAEEVCVSYSHIYVYIDNCMCVCVTDDIYMVSCTA